MRIVASKRSVLARARMATDYLLTDGQCMEFYYTLKGTSTVQVKSKGEDLIERELTARSAEVIMVQLMLIRNMWS